MRVKLGMVPPPKRCNMSKSTHPLKSKRNVDCEGDEESTYPTRRIKIRLADPNVPDSYVVEVYDTSIEEEDSCNDDETAKVAEDLVSNSVDSCGDEIGKHSSNETGERRSCRARKQSEKQKLRDADYPTPEDQCRAKTNNDITNYFKPSVVRDETRNAESNVTNGKLEHSCSLVPALKEDVSKIKQNFIKCSTKNTNSTINGGSFLDSNENGKRKSSRFRKFDAPQTGVKSDDTLKESGSRITVSTANEDVNHQNSITEKRKSSRLRGLRTSTPVMPEMETTPKKITKNTAEITNYFRPDVKDNKNKFNEIRTGTDKIGRPNDIIRQVDCDKNMDEPEITETCNDTTFKIKPCEIVESFSEFTDPLVEEVSQYNSTSGPRRSHRERKSNNTTPQKEEIVMVFKDSPATIDPLVEKISTSGSRRSHRERKSSNTTPQKEDNVMVVKDSPVTTDPMVEEISQYKSTSGPRRSHREIKSNNTTPEKEENAMVVKDSLATIDPLVAEISTSGSRRSHREQKSSNTTPQKEENVKVVKGSTATTDPLVDEISQYNSTSGSRRSLRERKSNNTTPHKEENSKIVISSPAPTARDLLVRSAQKRDSSKNGKEITPHKTTKVEPNLNYITFKRKTTETSDLSAKKRKLNLSEILVDENTMIEKKDDKESFNLRSRQSRSNNRLTDVNLDSETTETYSSKEITDYDAEYIKADDSSTNEILEGLIADDNEEKSTRKTRSMRCERSIALSSNEETEERYNSMQKNTSEPSSKRKVLKSHSNELKENCDGIMKFFKPNSGKKMTLSKTLPSSHQPLQLDNRAKSKSGQQQVGQRVTKRPVSDTSRNKIKKSEKETLTCLPKCSVALESFKINTSAISSPTNQSRPKDNVISPCKVVLERLRASLIVSPPQKSPNNSADGIEIIAEKPLAPIFMKKVRTNEPSPEILAARRNFLMAGVVKPVKPKHVPEDSDIDVPFFPNISHVMQKGDCEELWTKRSSDLKLRVISPYVQPPLKFRHEIKRKDIQKCEESKPPVSINELLKKLRNTYKNVCVEDIYNSFKKSFDKYSCAGESDENRSDESDVSPMFTYKYLPETKGILSNDRTVQRLRKWLLSWQEYAEALRNGSVTRTKTGGDSSDDFASSDDSDAQRIPVASCLLSGPTSSGKTALVQALATELGFNVLEINASSKRQGKKILADLQEATQSHKVTQDPTSSLSGTLRGSSVRDMLSVIVVEDADIVFEDQDDGFIAALSTLIASTKRPVFLLTCEPDVRHLDKFRNNQTLQLKMNRPHPKAACAVLELITLIEGAALPRATLHRLLGLNHFDLRRSILELQFWIPLKNRSSEICTDVPATLSRVWWTSHQLLFQAPLWHSPNPQKNGVETVVETGLQTADDVNGNSKIERLASFSADFVSYFDAISCADVCSVRPAEALHQSVEVKDSLSLDQDWRCFDWKMVNLGEEIETELLTKAMAVFNKTRKTSLPLQVRLPYYEERWLQSRSKATDELLEVIGEKVPNRSTYTDYLPILRGICRSENQRIAQNSKRRNRFYHYLKNVGASPTETNLELNCSTLYL